MMLVTGDGNAREASPRCGKRREQPGGILVGEHAADEIDAAARRAARASAALTRRRRRRYARRRARARCPSGSRSRQRPGAEPLHPRRPARVGRGGARTPHRGSPAHPDGAASRWRARGCSAGAGRRSAGSGSVERAARVAIDAARRRRPIAMPVAAARDRPARPPPPRPRRSRARDLGRDSASSPAARRAWRCRPFRRRSPRCVSPRNA